MLSERQQVRDWVHYHRGKFTSRMISDDTGIDVRNVAKRLNDLQRDGVIRIIDRDKTVKIWSKVRVDARDRDDEKLRQVMKGKTKAQAAAELGISRQALYGRIKEMNRRRFLG